MDRFSQKCESCGKIKKLDKFVINRTADTLSYYKRCLQCSNEASTRHYYKNKSIINNLKKEPCLDCKQSFNPWQMDFDHLPGQLKIDNVSRMTKLSSKEVMKEIAKCEVVCANCHRNRTHYRREHQKQLPSFSKGMGYLKGSTLDNAQTLGLGQSASIPE